MAQFAFDSQSAPQNDRNLELLPAGWYPCRATESSLEKTSAGTGTILKVTFEIIDGPHKNRKIWARMNVRNPNADAERIGNAQLRELCEAVNVLRMQDTVELHNKPVQVKVKVRKSDNPQYEDSNDVVGFKAIGATTNAAVPPAASGFARPPVAQPPVAAPAAQQNTAEQQQAQQPAAAPAPVQASSPVPPWQKRS